MLVPAEFAQYKGLPTEPGCVTSSVLAGSEFIATEICELELSSHHRETINLNL